MALRKDLICPTHPWLTFRAELAGLPPEVWMNLGEARSKFDHLATIPLKPGLQARLLRVYLAKGVHATTAIEGNSLSESQVLDILEKRSTTPTSKAYQEREVENVVDLLNEILPEVLEAGSYRLTLDDICRINWRVLQGLEHESHVKPGDIRTAGVGVGTYLAPEPRYLHPLLEEMCRWLNDPAFVSPESHLTAPMAILRSIYAHLYLAWIHPFGDGNGRTARALEFKILVSAGIPAVAAHLLSNFYNETRQQYYRELQYASESGGDVSKWIQYAAQGIVDGLRAQLEVVYQDLYIIAWRDYVYEQFEQREGRGKAEKVEKRLRDLALSIGTIPVPLAKIEELNAKVGRHYAKTSPQAVRRDLAELEELGLVVRQPDGYVSNIASLLRFRSARVE